MVLLYILAAVSIITAIPLANLLLLRSRAIDRTFEALIALAAGTLLGNALFHLIPEAIELIPASEALQLVAIGFTVTFGIEIFMRWQTHLRPSPDQKWPVGYLVLFDDAIHNIIDAAAVAATFLLSVPLGVATTLSVALHEIPHEIGDYGTLIYAGFSRIRALLYNFYSELIAFAGVALVVFLNIDVKGLISFSAFTAGVFLYVAAVDLIPELHRNPERRSYILHVLIVIAGMLLMQVLALVLPESAIPKS